MCYRECESGDHAQKGLFFFSTATENTQAKMNPKWTQHDNPLIELFQGKIVQMCSWVHKATGTLGLKKIL